MALNGQSLPSLPEGVVEGLLPARRRPEDDIADWDRLLNKDDPDQLQEYLLRHPRGRFAELARMKLERMGIEPLDPAPPAQAMPPPVAAAIHEAPFPSAELSHTFDPAPSHQAESDHLGDDAPTVRKLPIAAIVSVIVACVLAAGGYSWWRHLESERQTWQAVSRTEPSALRAYLSDHAAGPYSNEATATLSQLEEQRFGAASASNDAYALQTFLADFPQSAHAQDARVRLVELQAQNAFRTSSPSPLAPESGVVFDSNTQQVALQWAPLPRAVRYIVEVETFDPANATWVEDPASILRVEVDGETHNLDLQSAGVERWRVQAVDQEGSVSAFSDWSVFERKL